MGLSPFSKSSYDEDRGSLITIGSRSSYDDGLIITVGSRSSYDKPPPDRPPQRPPNPDPHNFRVLRSEEVGPYLLAEVLYPDCTNYEGRKILVYKGVSLLEVLAQGSVDPHFSNNPRFHSPIARFVPTEAGWKMARVLARTMSEGGQA